MGKWIPRSPHPAFRLQLSFPTCLILHHPLLRLTLFLHLLLPKVTAGLLLRWFVSLTILAFFFYSKTSHHVLSLIFTSISTITNSRSRCSTHFFQAIFLFTTSFVLCNNSVRKIFMPFCKWRKCGWKQPRCPIIIAWINECDIFLKMEYYIAVKNEEIQLSAATWILINT